MGRSLLFVVALTGVLVGLSLVDRGREASPLSSSLALTEPEAPSVDAAGDAAAPASAIDPSAFIDCLGDVSPPDSVPPSPPLTPRGVEEIADRVERLRELRFDGPVDVSFLTPAEIEMRISRLVERESDSARLRQAGEALELLGAIPPGSDLLELSRQALASQVIGVFVPGTEELLVVQSGQAGAIEAITLSHELEHALAFDDLGFPLPQRTRPGHGDRDLAAQSLIEGDATLTMQLYALRYIDLADQLSLLSDPSLSAGEGDLDDLPHFLQRQLIFPYEAGLGYVCALHERGGWEAVDRAYADPPRSTVELLDPAAGPVTIERPPAAGRLQAPWRSTLTDQLGAAELSWLFEAPGDDPARALPDPDGAAADWRGGRVELWEDGSRSALGIVLVEREGGSLCGAAVAFYAAAFPDAVLSRSGAATTFSGADQAAVVSCADGAIAIGIGPDLGVAEQLGGGGP